MTKNKISLSKIFQQWKNQKGFSLVEIMIVAGIMGGLALSLTEVLRQANQGKKGIELRYEYVDVLNKMRMYLADAEVCRNTFANPAGVNGSYIFTTSGATSPVNAITRTTRNGTPLGTPVNYYVRADHAVTLGDANLAVIDRKLRIADMTLVVNSRDQGLTWPPTVRETRLYDVQVNFETVNNTMTLPGGGVTFMTIAADTDTTGLIQDCYTAWDQLSQQVCNEMGGFWDPIGSPNRCIIRDVATDYVCEELGGTIANRRAPQPQVGTSLLPAPNPALSLSTVASKVCDISRVTNVDACDFINGEFDSGSGTCTLTNNRDLREMACAMAGGGSTDMLSFTNFAAVSGAERDSGSYCAQTTFGACTALGGTPFDTGVNGAAATAQCRFSCDGALNMDIGRTANQKLELCSQNLCNDLDGAWDNVAKTCDITNSNLLKRLACETAGYAWNTGTNVCEWQDRYEEVCAGYGGTWVWTDQTSNPKQGECQIGGLRYEKAMKQMACSGITRYINSNYSNGGGTPLYTAVPDYDPGTNTCTVTYTTDFTTFSFTEANYKWKYDTDNVGLFPTIGAGNGANVDQGITTGNIGIGLSSRALGGNSIAIGTNSYASIANNLAIGRQAQATSSDTLALGYLAMASHTSTIAIGQAANASGLYSVALGQQANAPGSYSIAAGTASRAAGVNATAVGGGVFFCFDPFFPDNTEDKSASKGFTPGCLLPLGGGARVTADYGAALGTFSMASGVNGSAIGTFAVASGTDASAIGTSAGAKGNSSTAVGKSAVTYYDSAIAMGANAKGSGVGAIAIGAGSNANNTRAVAIGSGVAAQGVDSLSLGINSRAIGTGSIGVGNNANSDGSYGTAIGYYADAFASYGVAYGYQSNVNDTALRGIAIGSSNYVDGPYGIAIGTAVDIYEAARYSVGIGRDCDVSTEYTVRLCNGAGDTCTMSSSGGWSCTSSRNRKKDLEELDNRVMLEKLLELPVYEYSGLTNSEQRIIGPMADDFSRIFQVGDDQTINSTSLSSISILAIQGLNKKMENQLQAQEEINRILETENAELKQRLLALEKLVHQSLESKGRKK